MFDEVLQFNGKHQPPRRACAHLPGPVVLKLPKLEAVPVLVLRLPGPVLKLPKLESVPVLVLRLVVVLPALKSVPVLGLGVDVVNDGSMIVEMPVGPVVDGSAAVVSPLAVGVLSGAPVLAFTVDGAGIVIVGRLVTPKHRRLNSRKENA